MKTVLVNNVPEPLLSHMRLNQSKYFSSAEIIKEIEQYCRAAKPSASSPTPMEVDAFQRQQYGGGRGNGGKDSGKKGGGKKGKDKGKDTKSKGKFKTKKGHDKSTGIPPSASPYFEGYCGYPYCGKWGNKKNGG